MELHNMLKWGVMAICTVLVFGVLRFTSYGSTIYSHGSNIAARSSAPTQNNPLADLVLKSDQRMSYLNKNVKDVCSKNTALQRFQRKTFIVRDEKRNLLFFPVPKIGSSFWKRVFKVMHSNSANVSLFDFSNNNAHSGKNLSERWVYKKEDLSRLSSGYESFVFVRDPFGRLFSGYVDKMFIPHSLGEIHIRAFYKRYPGKRKSVGSDISFSDFVMYVADAILENKMPDGHFYPMWHFCNPCAMNVSYIGKMEHFMDDTRYILSTVGIDINDVAKTQNDDKLKENDERGIIQDLIVFTFRYSRINLQTPDRILFILQRLWAVYKIRGYISKTAQMPPITTPKTITASEFAKLVLYQYDQDKITIPKEVLKAQRTESMMEAYSRVPLQILKTLAKAFETDCNLYDYSCDVVNRFEKLKLTYKGTKSDYFT